MVDNKKIVEVVIGTQKLTLRTDQDPAQVRRAAELVNSRLREIQPQGHVLSHQVLLLLAMNLADHLLKAEDGGRLFRAQVREKSQSILRRLDQEFPLHS